MNIKELLLTIMKAQGMTQTTLSEKAGYKSKSAITEILNRRGMKVEILMKLLSVMNCELVVKDKTTGEEYTITE